MARAPAKQAPVKGNFKKNQMTLWLSVAFVTVIIMSLPTVLIVVFGLLPTFVAYVIDRAKGKPAAYCVGGINICGVFPYMLQLWTGDNSMNAAINIMTDVFVLAVMYGAAAFGWMIYQSLPPIVTTFMTVIAQHRVSTLRAQQRELVDEWGKDGSTPQEILDLGEGIELVDESAPIEEPDPEPQAAAQPAPEPPNAGTAETPGTVPGEAT